MPTGTPFELTQKHVERINNAATELQKKHIDPETGLSIIEGIMSTAGSSGGDGASQSHVGRVMFEITPPEERALQVTSRELVMQWRQAIGDIPGAKEINYRAEIGRGGSPVSVRLSGRDFDRLKIAAQKTKDKLATYPGIEDITDTFASGKQELKLEHYPISRLR